MRTRLLFIFLTCLLPPGLLHAAPSPPLTLENELLDRSLEKFIQYRLEQPGNQANLSLTEIQSSRRRGDSSWKILDDSRLELGLQSKPYWVHFSVYNPDIDIREWYLNLGTAVATNVEIFLDNRLRHELRSDASFYDRPDSHNFLVFPLRTPPGEVQHYYIRFHSLGPVTIRPSISLKEHFEQRRYIRWVFYGLIYGTLLAMFIYHILLFIRLRDPGYLYYSLSFMFLFIMFFGMDGNIYKYFIQGDAVMQHRISMCAGLAALTLLLHFLRHFVELKNIWPIMARVFKFLAISLLFSIPVLMFSQYLFFNLILYGILYGLVNFFILVIMFYMGVFRNSYPARFYLAAGGIFLVGSITYVLTIFGYLPGNYVTWYAAYVGAALEAAILSVGLARRLRELDTQASRNQARFRSLLENSREITFTLDENFCFIELNHAVEDVLGWEPESLNGNHFLQLFKEKGNAASVNPTVHDAADHLRQLNPQNSFVEFIGVLKNIYHQEELQFRFVLEYVNWRGTREIFGRAYELNQQSIAGFVEQEWLVFENIQDFETTEVICRRVTDNLEGRLAAAQVWAVRYNLREALNACLLEPVGIRFEYHLKPDYVSYLLESGTDLPDSSGFQKLRSTFDRFKITEEHNRVYLFKFLR